MSGVRLSCRSGFTSPATPSPACSSPPASTRKRPPPTSGHASIQTTFDLYDHLVPGKEDEAVALVDAHLERANSDGRVAQLES
jgi:hypothetical protein